jgi:hypothetical protein
MSEKETLINTEQEPTAENVLDEYKTHVRSVNPQSKQSGAIVSIFGGSPCPWCKSNMTQQTIGSLVAVCDKNPLHIVKWIPWGG